MIKVRNPADLVQFTPVGAEVFSQNIGVLCFQLLFQKKLCAITAGRFASGSRLRYTIDRFVVKDAGWCINY